MSINEMKKNEGRAASNHNLRNSGSGARSTIITSTERIQQLTTTLSAIEIEFPTEAGSQSTEILTDSGDTGTTTEVNEVGHQKYEEHANHLLSEIRQQRQLKRYCDVVIKCGTRSFQAHRIILASASAYFDKILADTMTANNPVTVEMRCADEEIFIAVMNYIYTGSIRISTTSIKTILITAHVLQLSNLIGVCTEFLAARLHPTNCVSILLLAQMLDNEDLIARCRSFANITELLEHDNQLMLLDDNQFGKIISSEYISEDKRLAMIIQWVNHEACRRQEFIPTLCAFVRVPGLSRSYLSVLHGSTDMWNSSSWLAGFISGAIASGLQQAIPIGGSHTDALQQRRFEEVIMIAGGNYYEESVECYMVNNVLRSSCAYQSHAQNFPTLPNLPRGRHNFAAVELNGSVFVMGGETKDDSYGTRSVDIFDIALLCWKDGPPMRSRRTNFGAATLDGKIYAVGGKGENTNNTAEVYDPSSHRWRFIAKMLKSRIHLAAAAVCGRLYAVGGFEWSYSGSVVSSVEVYNPGTDSWTLVEPMCTQRQKLGACGLNDRLYAVGGSNDANTVNTAEKYNPETNTWQVIAPMKIERKHFGLVSDAQFLYAIGGMDGSEDPLTSVERYDPQTNEWTLLPVPLTKLRESPGFALVRIERRN